MSILSACASAAPSDPNQAATSSNPTTPDAGSPVALSVRSGAAKSSHVGYGSSENPRVLVHVVLATAPELCGDAHATHDDTAVTLEILTAEDRLEPQVLAHAQQGVTAGAFRGWVHRVASDCHLETGARGAPSVAFDDDATLEILAVDGDAITLRIHFSSSAGAFDGTITTQACTSPWMHLDVFEDDDALPGCITSRP